VTIAQINGTTIAYADAGTGPALLLVHGHPFDRSMWAPQVAAFRERYRVVTADLRGYGESAVEPGLVRLETFAADVASLADHLGIDTFVLGGLSMGGQIVMECYRQFPDRIRGLLLADTFPRADADEARAVRLATADILVRDGMRGYADANLAKMLAPYNVAGMPDVAAHVHRMMTGTAPEGAAAALRGRAERRDYCDLLAAVAVPALVVVGRDDEFTPVSDAEDMHARLPQSTLVVIDDAGHMPNLEQPTAFNEALASFLTQF
jgi:3-oxoadipate enol-lactonase